jgi:hypothetical protein
VPVFKAELAECKCADFAHANGIGEGLLFFVSSPSLSLYSGTGARIVGGSLKKSTISSRWIVGLEYVFPFAAP